MINPLWYYRIGVSIIVSAAIKLIASAFLVVTYEPIPIGLTGVLLLIAAFMLIYERHARKQVKLWR